MKKSKTDQKAKQKQPLRYSVPPYSLAVEDRGVALACLPGEYYETVERMVAPSAVEARGMLITLRRELHWSRSMLAAFLGVGRETLRRWEDGTRNPCGSGRRLIWLTNELAFRPKKIKNAVDLMFWGRGEELVQINRVLCSGPWRSRKAPPATPKPAKDGNVGDEPK